MGHALSTIPIYPTPSRHHPHRRRILFVQSARRCLHRAIREHRQRLDLQLCSHIAWGAGPQRVSHGSAALWEPFLMVYENQLVCFFSDSRDPAHSQKLSYATSSDLLTWSDAANTVAYTTYKDRPGMATVAYTPPTENYIITYEYCGVEGCGITYRLSLSPLTFGAAADKVVSPANTDPPSLGGNPYVFWTEHPDRTDGSILLIPSTGSWEEVFVNDDVAGRRHGGGDVVCVFEGAKYQEAPVR
ncbi:hypothetical protein BJX63DRAFT_428172 [Aspergillus granulosus]|uniref:Uncharacterized protein n=1 Tax=Aspergillus granulosus TaxID=176169 RepID=A0ABR4HXX7_9EURO